MQDGFKLNHDKAKIQDICYLADMVFIDREGLTHITDVKGSLFNIEAVFKIKWKMLKFINRDFKYHIVMQHKNIWYDIEDKEQRKAYKLATAKKKKVM